VLLAEQIPPDTDPMRVGPTGGVAARRHRRRSANPNWLDTHDLIAVNGRIWEAEGALLATGATQFGCIEDPRHPESASPEIGRTRRATRAPRE
jgi:hypothetical protein